METKAKLFWGPTLLSTLLLLVAFFFGHSVFRTKSLQQAQQWGEGLSQGLGTLLDQKDDMGLIDWARDLESAQTLAFKVTSQGKVMAEGGNLSRFPNEIPNGTRFRFPSAVLMKFTAPTGKVPFEFVLLVPAAFPPLLGGGGLGAGVLIGLVTGFWLCSIRRAEGRKIPFPGRRELNKGSTPLVTEPMERALSGEASLLLDPKFTILEITPEALGLLVPGSKEGPPSHLLDLSPEPRLMEVLEKGVSVELKGAFLSRPDLMIHLTPLPTGTRVVLMEESKEGPKSIDFVDFTNGKP